ncbi:MAG TPA: GFA family protein [Gammaproteobacteria bacterium]|nr:GFA family protein [Gammaproteobacteria bacterium]
MYDARIYTGRCFCNAVEFEISGEPFAMGYCHCESCRQWSGTPLTAFSLWRFGSVTFTKGEDRVGCFSKSSRAARKWCEKCGGHLLTESAESGFSDVFPALVSDFEFRPAMHVHYRESVLRIKDGLPKWRDLPDKAGGSGKLLAE